MPCYDPDSHNEDPIPSAALCGILRVLEAQGTLDYIFHAVDYRRAGIKESELRNWWAAHKASEAA